MNDNNIEMDMAGEIINFKMPKNEGNLIQVIGVGGGGCNAVNHMYKAGITDVTFMVCNTDAQVLRDSPVPTRLQLGVTLTNGLGAGNEPELGRQAAIENLEDVKKAIDKKAKMVFITAGMGGGTGTGAAPVIARACLDAALLTVGIVTLPFRTEGSRRFNQAVEGIKNMQDAVDALLIINNERIREMFGNFRLSEAFSKADDVLTIAAKGIADIITKRGYVNVDFADVQRVMRGSGIALMGAAKSEGDKRAINAVEAALNSPLLNHNDINGAKNILLNVTSGTDNDEITMEEIGEILNYVQAKAGNGADIIWGAANEENMGRTLSLTVIATGYSVNAIPEIAPRPITKTVILDNGGAVTPAPRPSQPTTSAPPPRTPENPGGRRPAAVLATGTAKPRTGTLFGDTSAMTDAELDLIDRANTATPLHPSVRHDRPVSTVLLSVDDNDNAIISRNPFYHDQAD
ncbi:MAG: cell division protein FtsZ [Bacteroidales bacterium]|jgi:cell division protein FtsZ|nr:cell division protein FtsZ [Bacteroidales bacterium]